jgi:hypothetical protein
MAGDKGKLPDQVGWQMDVGWCMKGVGRLKGNAWTSLTTQTPSTNDQTNPCGFGGWVGAWLVAWHHPALMQVTAD